MENKIQEVSLTGIAYYKNGMTSMLAVWCWMVKFPTRPREMRSLMIAAMGSAHVASMCCTSALLDLIRKKNKSPLLSTLYPMYLLYRNDPGQLGCLALHRYSPKRQSLSRWFTSC
jgi:hypothetical protein